MSPIVQGFALGLMGSFAALGVFYLCWLAYRWWAVRARIRHMLKNRPPKGTRPDTHITIEGIDYDVTEQLVRRADRSDGGAVWVIVGPQHVRMARGTAPTLHVCQPVPLATEVRLFLVASDDKTEARFATLEEIDEAHEPYIAH